jgi:hypothetical protein
MLLGIATVCFVEWGTILAEGCFLLQGSCVHASMRFEWLCGAGVLQCAQHLILARVSLPKVWCWNIH